MTSIQRFRGNSALRWQRSSSDVREAGQAPREQSRDSRPLSNDRRATDNSQGIHRTVQSIGLEISVLNYSLRPEARVVQLTSRSISDDYRLVARRCSACEARRRKKRVPETMPQHLPLKHRYERRHSPLNRDLPSSPPHKLYTQHHAELSCRRPNAAPQTLPRFVAAGLTLGMPTLCVSVSATATLSEHNDRAPS